MRTSFAVYCWLTMALLLLSSGMSHSVEAAPPNVLLIVSEDNGPELGCYGDPYARTPNLDKLASGGMRFNRAFVPQAGCSPSRASFLTGLYPHQHGQIGLATHGFRLYRTDTPNLPSSLKAAGYRTGLIGKLHINPESAFPFDFHKITNGNFARKRLGDYAKHAETFFGDGDQPFFLSVNFPDAHDPWQRQVGGLPRQPQTGKDVKSMPYMGIDPSGMREMVADYYNSLARLDSLVGDLLSALERSGKAGNTIVIYLGDHGADMLRGKRTCYEGGLRIPLIVRWPGHIEPQVRDELVSTIDLMPTVLAAVGADMVAGLPGRPLQPLFDAGPRDWRTHLFAEYHTHAANNYYPQRSVRTERYKLIENMLAGEVHPDFDLTIEKLSRGAERRQVPGGLDLPSAIASAEPQVSAAYALMRRPSRYELYDLQSDPFEFRNLADEPAHASTLRELQHQLITWRQQTDDPLLQEQNLRRLTEEVRDKAGRRKDKDYVWGYPDYFFGREPAANEIQPIKKKKR